mgnify:CR=1 FL=1
MVYLLAGPKGTGKTQQMRLRKNAMEMLYLSKKHTAIQQV